MNQRKIIINPSPTEENLKNLLKSASGDIFRWAYLGENTFTYLSLQKKMSEVSDEILIGESLQETAHLFSDDYIDYVGDLSLENDSLSWWSNNFSERIKFFALRSNRELIFCIEFTSGKYIVLLKN